MAWYSKIENGLVVDITYLVDNLDSSWLYREYGGTWLRCAEDGSLRNVFPTIGYTYDEKKDKFFPPQPFPSWVLNEKGTEWKSPTPIPTDGKMYSWDELAKAWIEKI